MCFHRKHHLQNIHFDPIHRLLQENINPSKAKHRFESGIISFESREKKKQNTSHRQKGPRKQLTIIFTQVKTIVCHAQLKLIISLNLLGSHNLWRGKYERK